MRGLLFSLVVAVTTTLVAGDWDFFGLECKLPGWPGHPAPVCDPQSTKEDECCPGTVCAIDPTNPAIYSCQKDKSISPAEFALTSHLLASQSESVLSQVLFGLKQDSLNTWVSSSVDNNKEDTAKVMKAATKRADKSAHSRYGGQQQKQGGNDKGFDYSQYIPPNSKHVTTVENKHAARLPPSPRNTTSARVENTEDSTIEDQEEEDDFLRVAALALLRADVQLHAMASQGKREVLEKVLSILDRLRTRVQSELDHSTTTTTNNVTDNGSSSENNNDDDFWSRYLPHIPPVNTGDRRPGSLGGPCGKTNFRDFGTCVAKNRPLMCVGGSSLKPGLCRVNNTASMDSTSKTVSAVYKDLQLAQVNLFLANLEEEPAPTTTTTTPPPVDDVPSVMQFSTSSFLVVGLGFLVLVYFCIMRTQKSKYQVISSQHGEGWADRT